MSEREENSNWWVGVVSNVMDPYQSGRVQVRVFGRHDNTTAIPDADLPWAQVTQPISSAGLGRMGSAPVGLVKGSRVLGMWADRDRQLPIVTGVVGKAGDVKPGSTVGGAPEIDSATGSIPGASQASSLNPYTALNPGRVSISQIDGGQASIDSVKRDDGVVLSKEVEQGMKYADVPTIGSAKKTDDSSILDMFKTVDPRSRISALPCLPFNSLQINIQLNLTSLISGIVGIVANAIRNAILELAARLGIAKILKALNEVVNTMNSVRNLIAALASIQICGISPLNNGIASAADMALAQAVSGINSITRFTSGALNYVAGAGLDNTIRGLINVPLSRVPGISFSPFAGVQVEPPAAYVQEYHSYKDDPYPGYIKWVDPANVGDPIFTLRSGQPNYDSPQQHTQFATQRAVSASLGGLVTGSISGPGLLTAIQGATTFASAFGAKSVLGNGFSPASLINLAASIIPSIVAATQSIFNPKITVSVVDQGAFRSLGNDFIKNQALRARRAQLLAVGVT